MRGDTTAETTPFPFVETSVPVRPRLFDLWVETGKSFTKEHDKLQWKIGDWLVEGQSAYGEKIAYANAESITGKKRQTLYQFASVAKRVPVCMRHTNLSWEHHQIVAPLEPKDQKAWLELASERDLKAKELRRALKGEMPPRKGEPPAGWKGSLPHGWKFYMLPLHIETYESLLALAKARQIEPGEFGGKTIPAPIRVVHGIVLQYLEDHKEEVESAEFNAAYESLGIGATSRRAKKASSDKQDSKVVN